MNVISLRDCDSQQLRSAMVNWPGFADFSRTTIIDGCSGQDPVGGFFFGSVGKVGTMAHLLQVATEVHDS